MISWFMCEDEPEYVSPAQAWQLLANAIVIRAALDYKSLLEGRWYEDPRINEKIAELERFFHSDYYALLTDVDADMILNRIREEVNRGRAED